MADRSRFDQNNRNSLIAVSNADGETPVTLWADPSTHQLITSSSGGGGGTGAIIDGVSSSIKATVVDYITGNPALHNPLAVILTNTSGGTVSPITSSDLTDGSARTQLVDNGTNDLDFTLPSSGTPFALPVQIVDSSGNQNDNTYSWLYDSTGVGLTATGTALDVNIASGGSSDSTSSTTSTSDTATIAGNPVATTAPGVQLNSIAGPTGDPIDTVGNSLSTYISNQLLPVLPSTVADTVKNGIIGASGQSVTFTGLQGYNTVMLYLSGTFSITTTAEVTIDGTTWVNTALTNFSNQPFGGMALSAPSATAQTGYAISVAGYIGVRIRSTAYTSGQMSIYMRATAQPITNNWPVQVTSGGTNVALSIGIPVYANFGSVQNASGNWDPTRSVTNAINSTGIGISAAGILAQLDDTSPTAITENQFGNLRMSSDRGLLAAGIYSTTGATSALRLDAYSNLQSTIRDASGFARGANVTADNKLLVSDSTAGKIAGEDTVTSAPGVQLVSLAGPTGDPIDSIGNAVSVAPVSNAAKSGAPISVLAATTVLSLLTVNTSRKGATIYNDSTAIMYLLLGPGASTTNFTTALYGNSTGVGGYYETPFGYTGVITAVWASATGSARVTELI